MTDTSTTPENEPALPTLRGCQGDAVVLAGMLRGIDLMQNEGKAYDEARHCITMVAMERAVKLADDLDEVAS